MSLETLTTLSWWMVVPLVAVGSLLHFAYDWSGHHRAVAVFGAVNESYWEHTKIAVWPVLVWQVALFAAGGHRYAAFVPAATVALYSVPLTMIGLVVLYKRVTRRNVLVLDIAVFALVIAVAQLVFVQLVRELTPSATTVGVSVAYLVALVGAYASHTLAPPAETDIFVDPVNQRYGVAAHPDAPTND